MPSRQHEKPPALADGGGGIFLRVAEALPGEVGDGVARLDPRAFMALGIAPGEIVAIAGRRTTLVRTALDPGGEGRGLIRLDGLLRDNARTGLDARVALGRATVQAARAVELTPTQDGEYGQADVAVVRRELADRPVSEDDHVRVAGLARGPMRFRVQRVDPGTTGLVTAHTSIRIGFAPSVGQESEPLRYEAIGGLQDQLRRVRELVELPIKYPALFARLGIEPPRGILLHGPPGTGKTLIGRAVAAEVDAHFVLVNGPEIVHKHYGESEARLREIFEEAQQQAPSIIFLDEIDAIAPKRSDVAGDMERRIVAQLLTLMDGLVSRGHVVVIGATNMPDLLDPALRRPGRFDREIAVGVPNLQGRQHILRIHARDMPLADDVDLDRLAEALQGFVGADIEVLCKEAGMLALHEVLEHAGLEVANPAELADRAQVHLRHFLGALPTIEPTATREILVERAKASWADVGGLTEVREFLDMAVVLPRRSPELFGEVGLRPPKGIVLSGAPGTGKSLVAHAIAHQTDMRLLIADAAMVHSKWLGESEKILRQVFVKARQAAPCVLLFDQLDALVPARVRAEGAGGSSDRLLGQLMSELDNLDQLSGVLVLATTNRPDLIDPALLSPGRLEYVVEFPMPDLRDRQSILGIHAARLPLAPDVDLDGLAVESEGLTGGDLAQVCQRAAMSEFRALSRTAGSSRDTLSRLRIPQAQFRAALEVVKARTNHTRHP